MKHGKIIIDDAEYITLLTDKYLANSEYKPEKEDKILSFIPGLIHKVMVKKGNKVRAGECLVILEAMKMYNEITLHYDVKIDEVCVEEGETIPKNHILVRYTKI